MIKGLPLVAILASACVGQSGPGMSTPQIDTVVHAARADAVRRSGRAPDRITLVNAESVTWRDGSLGCPWPGMLYTDALVPGYRVRLRDGGEVLDYHAGERGGLVLCPPGLAREPAPDSRN